MIGCVLPLSGEHPKTHEHVDQSPGDSTEFTSRKEQGVRKKANVGRMSPAQKEQEPHYYV